MIPVGCAPDDMHTRQRRDLDAIGRATTGDGVQANGFDRNPPGAERGSINGYP